MEKVLLTDVAVLLGAVAIAAPVARRLGIGTVLGYLVAGALVGPDGLGQFFSTTEARELLHLAEFGVVLLLFLIGLELRPMRLWAMRGAIFGLGGAQVALTGCLLAFAAMAALALSWQSALFVGLALALSSTAFALQVMEENKELATRHGRLGFAVLLFQDLAAIPLIALTPLFAVGVAGAASGMDVLAALKALGVIVAVVVGGYLTLDYFIRLVALTKVREAMTAAALLIVVGLTIVMQWAGLSASLGAFIAGALLAESSYRHQLEADIQPFEGLLLGLFFTAIGMSLDLDLLLTSWLPVLAMTAGVIATKAGVLYFLGRRAGLDDRPARRLGLSLSQGGEFAFVLVAAGTASHVVDLDLAALISLVVTLSMAATPILLALDRFLAPKAKPLAVYDTLPENSAHVVIAGFGRYGQIVARILRAKKIPFTALDIDAEQVEFVRKFGSQAFFGDASRPEILEAARLGEARAFVLAIDDVDASLKAAEHVRQTWPNVPIFARARNRNHVHRFLDLGVKVVQRETYFSALETTRQLLKGLGYSETQAERTIGTFRTHDERRLIDDYAYYDDLARMQERARSSSETLEKLFDEDAKEELAAQQSSGKAKARQPAAAD
ncbi:MAG: monovalent cation:proton antiporter-2 (CPA2) family protein [Hyphomicrobium sp.]|nr:monovalent cation:proton antiporter-2 (CPA2) family protein [Hyphomicrobium sp.]